VKKYLIDRFCNYIEKCCEEDRLPCWPLVDPNKIDVEKIVDYFGSEKFLGTGLYMWKEMRKIDKER